MLKKVIVPTLGLDIEEATIEKWLKAEGERVVKDEPLLVLETEKAAMEINAPATGLLRQVLQSAGATVPVTQTVAYIEVLEPGEAPAELSASTAAAPSSAGNQAATPNGHGPAPAPALATPASAAPQTPEEGTLRASPAARKAASKLGVDLSQVRGTGPGGRIQGEDVQRFAEAMQQAEKVKASPVARRAARELVVDLSNVAATGLGGRITREDVEAAAQARKAAAVAGATPVAPTAPSELPAAASAPDAAAPVAPEQPAFAAGLPGKLAPLGRKRRVTADRMALSSRNVARITLNVEVDASELIHLRTRLMPLFEQHHGVRLPYDALLARVVAAALADHPYLNARWTDQGIYLVEPVNVGVAIAVEDGLVVPVIRDAARKRLAEVAVELSGLQAKAKEDRLTLDEMTGGTFTLTNLGMFGIDSFTPIVNPPETAILGVGRIVEKPVGREGQIVLRPMMILSLSVDHRIVDGAPAARFLHQVVQTLEEPCLLI